MTKPVIRYYKFEQRSPKWYAYKKDKWSSSTAIDLLRGKKTPPEQDSDYDNKYMQRGRILEKLAIAEYERKYNTKVFHFGGISNSRYKNAWFSPDGIEPNIVDEVKAFKLEKHDKIIKTGIVPTEVMAQVQFGLLISLLPKARLILYNPDSDIPLFVIEILADEKIQANLHNRLKATEPKARPSLVRARRKYVEANAIKIKQKRHERYIRSKAS